MRQILFGLGLLLASISSFSQQVAKTLTAANGQTVGFLEYKPTNYQSNGNKYPLIIFLHGLGERGNGTTEIQRVAVNAIPRYIKEGNPMTFTYNGVTETFLVLSPQLHTNYGDWQPFYTDEMLKYAKQNLNVDQNRIYLTGLSLGGGGTWNYVETSQNNANQFAAIAPVCASSFIAAGACFVSRANLPIWAFHAVDDGTCSVNITIQGIATVNSCTPTPSPAPMATYYSNGGHWIWDRAYDVSHNIQNPNMYEWFLSKNKNSNPNQNQAPVAKAGNDQVTTLPNRTVTVNGSSSYDPDGTITNYAWSYVSGPSTYTISSPSAATTNITNLVAGSYSFRLTVTDQNGASASDVVSVQVNAADAVSLPVAIAGPAQTITSNSTLLNAYGSYSPNGPIVTYAWTQVSGPNTAAMANTNAATPTVSGLVPGTYAFKLTITDNVGASASAQVTVTVGAQAAPLPPVAVAGQPFSINTTSTPLSAYGSYSPNGQLTNYTWTQVSGPNTAAWANSSSSAPTVSGLANGVYVFKLTVTDNLGGTASANVQVTVSGIVTAVPPVAVAGATQNITISTGLLNAYGSYSETGVIVGFSWTQVSGPNTATMANSNSSTPTLSNLVNGSYVFRLTVRDNLGATGTAETTINVSGVGAAAPPVAYAGPSQTITTNSTLLNAYGSYSPTGTITAYNWIQVTGPNTSTMANANSATPTVSNLVSGVYLYRLTVTDNKGATGTAQVTVSVNDAMAAPVAIAGEPQVITSTEVLLNAFGSYSPNGSIDLYDWTQVAGPSNANMLYANSATPRVSNMVQGTYTFQLTIKDNKGATAANATQVTVVLGALPVEFTYFKGSKTGNDVTLEWGTASEQNNDYFAVERSTDGLNYSVIGSVKGALYATTASAYSYKDVLAPKGNVYYRLRQVDKDLKSKLSRVVLINGTGKKLIEDIYPNPVKDKLVITLLNEEKGNGSIVVYDLAGRIRKQQLIRKDQDLFNANIQMTDLSPGFYIIEVRVGSSYKVMQRVVKQ